MDKLAITRGDITKFEGDAIVNAANNALLGGGGVDGAIHRAAGPELLEACRKLNGCGTGEAKVTPGFLLPARLVIHTVGPVWHNGQQGESKALASCYRESLKLAVEHGAKSIAFPAISTGVYGFPKDLAADIAIRTVKAFKETSARGEDLEVTLVCFDSESYDCCQQALKAVED